MQPSLQPRVITANEIQLVQNLVERCLQMCLTQSEVMSVLQQHARIEPEFTRLVWEKLEEQNRDFFDAYYLRMRLKEQVIAFNSLLEEQAALLRGQGAPGWQLGAAAPSGSRGTSFGAFAPFSAGLFDDLYALPGAAQLPLGGPHHHHLGPAGGAAAAAPFPHALHAPTAAFAPGAGAGAGGAGAGALSMPRSFSLSDLGPPDPLLHPPEPLAHFPPAAAFEHPLGGLEAGGAAQAALRDGAGAQPPADIRREGSLARLPHTFSLSDIACAMFKTREYSE